MKTPLSITRYRNTRYWAIWLGGDLLAVTVYRKGAEAILHYINSKKAHTMRSNKYTESPMIGAITREGKRVRVRATAGGTSICYKGQGKWSADETCTIPLPELLAEGVLKLADQKARTTYEKFCARGRRVRRNAAQRQEAQAKVDTSLPWEASKEAEARDEEEPLTSAEDEPASPAEVEPLTSAEAEPTTSAEDEPASPAESEPTTLAEAEPVARQEEQAARLSTYNLAREGELIRLHPGMASVTLQAGDILIRRYKKALVQVIVRAIGAYEWAGEVYPTLTHISWKATGYQISGNSFFGLPATPRSARA